MKKAIVVVSFGTTYNEAIDTCIMPIERAIAEAFGEYDVYRAFTSGFVKKRLGERGIAVDCLPEVLAKLIENGYAEVVIQPTHIMDGAEYRKKVVAVCESYRDSFTRVWIGRPLLGCCGDELSGEDCLAVVRAIAHQFPSLSPNEAVVLMGHGSQCVGSTVYACLQNSFTDCGISVVVGVMEDSDAQSFEYVLHRLQEWQSVDTVHLMPFLVVAGCHTQRDMVEGESSWRVRLEEAGYQVMPYLRGLGANPFVRALYVERIRMMITEN